MNPSLPPLSRPDPRDAARTLVLPRLRTFNRWGIRGTLVLTPLLFVAVFFAMRHVASVERGLTSLRDDSARIMVYETLPGDELRVALYAGADLVRFSIHAYGRSLLSAGRPTATLLVTGGGSGGMPQELITVKLLGTSQRLVAEEPWLSVGDPAPVNVAPAGTGDITLKLVALDGAEGILVRCYQRVHPSSPPAEATGETPLHHAAALDGLADLWGDAVAALPPAARDSHELFRWVRAVPTRGAKGYVRAHPLFHTIAPPRAVAPLSDRRVGSVVVTPGQRLWVTPHGPTEMRVIADQSTVTC